MATLAVLDAETSLLRDGERPRTKFWGLAVDGEDYRAFKTTAALWKFLRQREDPLLLYHHHDFDPLQAICDGAPLNVADMVHGRILRCRGPGKHEWRNSHKLFPAALSEILSACGFQKKSLDDLDARNVGDTVEALEAFKRIAEGFELAFGVYPLGAKYLTAASVAFHAAIQRGGPLPVHLDNHKAYRGGRVEAFRVSREYPRGLEAFKAAQYDICSSYPAAFADLPNADTLHYANVEVDTKGPCPFVAISRDDKLLFPRGRFETAFYESSYDRYIRPHGSIKRVKILRSVRVDLSWIKRVCELIREAYSLRLSVKKENPPLAYACKIGLNSIYGRLGMGETREVAWTGEKVASGTDVAYYPLPGGKFLSCTKIATEPTANYLFAGAITCNARARLYDALRRNPGAYYCDTDSVFLPPQTVFEGRTGDQLGDWKFEGNGTLAIRGLKDYVWNGHVKRKGGAAHFEWTAKKALTRGVVREVRKRRVSSYDKREILPNGNTLPLTFWDW